MSPLVQIVLVVCVVVITIALVPTILAMYHAIRRAERALEIIERDVPPLITEIHALTQELLKASHQARDELDRLGTLTGRAGEIAEGLGRVVTAVAGLTRAGQLVGVAAGLKSGLDVFLHRFRKSRGDHNE